MKTNILLGIIATALVLIVLKLFGATFSGILITLVIGTVLLVLTVGFLLSACLAIENSYEKHSWWKYVIASMVGWFIFAGIPMIILAEVLPEKINSLMLTVLDLAHQNIFLTIIFWIIWYVFSCIGSASTIDTIDEERRRSKLANRGVTS